MDSQEQATSNTAQPPAATPSHPLCITVSNRSKLPIKGVEIFNVKKHLFSEWFSKDG